MPQRETRHQMITRDFGDDRRARNRKASRVAVNDCGVHNGKRAHGLAVDQDVIRHKPKTAESASHREHARLIDVETLDLAYRGCAECPVERTLTNFHRESYALVSGELLGVVNARNGAHVRWHDDGACDDRPGEWTATDFVDAGDERAMQRTDLLLDRRPSLSAMMRALPLRWSYIGRAVFGSACFGAHCPYLIAFKLQRRRRAGKPRLASRCPGREREPCAHGSWLPFR